MASGSIGDCRLEIAALLDPRDFQMKQPLILEFTIPQSGSKIAAYEPANKTLDRNCACVDVRVWRGGARATDFIPQTNGTAQSVSTGRRLAKSAEDNERRQMG